MPTFYDRRGMGKNGKILSSPGEVCGSRRQCSFQLSHSVETQQAHEVGGEGLYFKV